MRRLPALLLTIAAAAAVAACSAGSAPGWTYAPAASGTPVPSGGASGAPSAGASAASSGTPSVAPSAAAGDSATPSGGGGGVAITIKAPVGASTTGFDPTTAEAAAGTAFSLTFDNEDNQAPHNLVIFNPDGTTKVAIQGDTAFFTGPAKRDYQVPALTAGT